MAKVCYQEYTGITEVFFENSIFIQTFYAIDFFLGSSCSLELNAFLIHWLTSLANGKIILIADYDSGNERESLSFSFCHKGLLGCPLPSLPKTKSVVSSNAVNFMKTVARRLGSRWTNLNFFVNFPEDTAH